MKTLYAIILMLLVGLFGYSQAPEAFNYQAVIRNASGDILTNSQIALQVSILQDSESGSAVYVERFNPTTNDYGLIALKLGKGTVQSGTFSTIDWGTHEYYIKIEVDPNNGTDFTALGTTQLLSVPYALYARSASALADNSITSEMIIDGEIQTEDIANGAVTADKIDDGEGSGLDADLLDGQDGSFYRDAENINSGPLNNAYFSAYGDLMAEGYLDESSANDLVTLAQAESRYAKPKIAFYAYNNTSDAMAGESTWHAIEFDTEVFDDGNNYNNVNDVFIAPVDGVYHFTAKVGTTSTINAIGNFIMGITINGIVLKLQLHYSPTTDTHEETHNGSIILKLDAGDAIGISVYSSADVAFTIAGGNYSTSFCGYLIYAD